MRNLFWIIIICFAIGAGSSVAKDDEKAENPSVPTPEEQEIIEIMEILELIEMLEHMDMLADYKLLVEEEKDAEND